MEHFCNSLILACFLLYIAYVNPLLLTGVLNVGGKLLSGLFPDNPVSKALSPSTSEKAEMQAFMKTLANKGVEKTSGLAAYLQSENVQDADGVDNLIGKLEQQLRHHPHLKQPLEGVSATTPLSLHVKDGLYSLSTPDGVKVSFREDSEEGFLAKQLHQLKSLSSLQKDFPFENISSLANKVANNQRLSALWSLSST